MIGTGAGNWWANGIDLSNYAWNVENRDAGLSVSAKRGDNRTVPGRAGTYFRKKVHDESHHVFNMWVAGCNRDGSMPADLGSATMVRDNVDQLMRIFGTDDLLEIARSEPGVPFGMHNFLPNPSFQSKDGKDITAVNVINNPSLEWGDGTKVFSRRNFANNPSMELGRRATVYRTNHVRNPAFLSEGKVVVWRTNLILNPSVEATLAPWTKQNATAVTRTNFAVKGSWPPVVNGGNWTVRVTSMADGNAGANSGPFRVTAGQTYSFRFEMWNATPGNRTFRGQIMWKRKDGTVISQIAAGDTVIAKNNGQMIYGSIVAPAGAVTGIFIPMCLSSVNGDQWYFDKVLVEQSTVLAGPYFDGNTPERDGNRYRWKGEDGNSQSEGYAVYPLGWGPGVTDGSRFFGITTEVSLTGVTSAKVFYTGASGVPTDSILIGQYASFGCKIPRLAPASCNVWVRLFDGITATRSVNLLLKAYDSDGNYLGPCKLPGVATADMGPQNVLLRPGEWVAVGFDGAIVPKGAAVVGISLSTGEAWSQGDGVYVDNAIMESEMACGSWFNGFNPDDDVFTYEWTGETHDSESLCIGFEVFAWGPGVNCRQFRVMEHSFYGSYAMRLQPPPSPPNLPMYAPSAPLDVEAGKNHIASIYARASRAMTLMIAVTFTGREKDLIVSNLAVPAGTWTRLNVSGMAPDDVDADNVVVRVGYAASQQPADGDYIDFDGLLFEATDSLLPFFSGDSGGNYDWQGEPHRSISVGVFDRAYGWVPIGNRPTLYRVQQTTGLGAPQAWRGTHWGTVLSTHTGPFGVSASQDAIDPGSNKWNGGIYIRTIDADVDVTIGIAYYDEDGNQISAVEAVFACTQTAWKKCSIAGGVAPDGTVVGAMYVMDSRTAAGVGFDFDGAYFGYGTNVYHDGDDVGWQWTAEDAKSQSYQWQPHPAYYQDVWGTIVQDTSWSLDPGGISGKFTAGGGGQSSMTCLRPGKGSGERNPVTEENKDWLWTFRFTVKAITDVRITPAFRPYMWDGHTWGKVVDPDNEVLVRGGTYDIKAGEIREIELRAKALASTVDPGTEATHWSPTVLVYKYGGGKIAPAGTAFNIDHMLQTPYSDWDAIHYIDGDSPWCKWLGTPHNSMSKVYGPARILYAECRDAIDMTSSPSQMARFSVDLVAPGVYWEDPIESTKKFLLASTGSDVDLVMLTGNVAPIFDAVIRVTGPMPPFTLTNVADGSSVSYHEPLHDGEVAVFDVGQFIVTDGHGRGVMYKVSHSGSPYLLPISNEPGADYPRIHIDAENIGKGATMQVTAKRKYHTA